MEMYLSGLPGGFWKTLRSIQATRDKDFIWGGTESGKKAQIPDMEEREGPQLAWGRAQGPLGSGE